MPMYRLPAAWSRSRVIGRLGEDRAEFLPEAGGVWAESLQFSADLRRGEPVVTPGQRHHLRYGTVVLEDLDLLACLYSTQHLRGVVPQMARRYSPHATCVARNQHRWHTAIPDPTAGRGLAALHERHGRCRPARAAPADGPGGVVRSDGAEDQDHFCRLRVAGLGQPGARQPDVCPTGRILITGTKPSGPPHPGRRVGSRRHPGQLKIFNGGGSIDDVLGGDLKAAACSPLVELGELVAGFPLVGGHTRPDGAPGGHKQTLRARQHITGRTRRSANRLA